MTQETGSRQPAEISVPVDRAEVIRYLVVFALLWVLLTQGAVFSWVIGILVIPLATWAVLGLQRPASRQQNPSVKLVGLLRFLPFFFWQSLSGGWDCAMFAIHPRRRLRLGLLSYTTRLPSGRPELYFLHVISLLPGTVSAALDGNDLTIHALDIDVNHQQSLAICEQKVAMLFGIQLENIEETHPARAANGSWDAKDS